MATSDKGISAARGGRESTACALLRKDYVYSRIVRERVIPEHTFIQTEPAVLCRRAYDAPRADGPPGLESPDRCETNLPSSLRAAFPFFSRSHLFVSGSCRRRGAARERHARQTRRCGALRRSPGAQVGDYVRADAKSKSCHAAPDEPAAGPSGAPLPASAQFERAAESLRGAELAPECVAVVLLVLLESSPAFRLGVTHYRRASSGPRNVKSL